MAVAVVPGNRQMIRLRMLAVALALGIPSLAMAAGQVIVHRDPGCGCCSAWARLLKAQLKRDVTIIDDQNRPTFARGKGVPADLGSCHTAVIDGMVFEGHVPIEDIKRVLAERPKGVTGLAVAGMPIGSPGMEMPGRPAQAYSVIAFGPAGRSVYARHGG